MALPRGTFSYIGQPERRPRGTGVCGEKIKFGDITHLGDDDWGWRVLLYHQIHLVTPKWVIGVRGEELRFEPTCVIPWSFA